MKYVFMVLLSITTHLIAYEKECHIEGASSGIPFGGRPYNYTYVDFMEIAGQGPAAGKRRQICYVLLSDNDKDAVRAAYGTFESEDSIQKILDTVLPNSVTAQVIRDLMKIKEVDSALYLMVGNLKDLIEKRMYQGST